MPTVPPGYDIQSGITPRLLAWCRVVGPATWVQWMLTRDDHIGKAGIPNMACGKWALSRWTWQDNLMLAWYGLDTDFSVRLYRPIAGGAVQWGVDFEQPVRETPIGFDTFDLLLDITLDQDLNWRWKDCDEYERARRLGVITDADHARVERARDRAVAFIELAVALCDGLVVLGDLGELVASRPAG
ncbi:hypothetical protein [Micromonospora sp. NPDC047740]|uniref:hypothetical protein n=1 Tax=Micromonospora sp. NPDC047740 TaxID=3364254 RepID=UPI003710E3A1